MGGPLHRLFSRLITPANIEQLGFVDIDAASKLMEKAFVLRDGAAMRAAIVLAQWIVLSKEFNIPKAGPPNADVGASHIYRVLREESKAISKYMLKWVCLMF